MHHYSLTQFKHTRATVDAKHVTILHCRYKGAKIQMERGETCGKSHV